MTAKAQKKPGRPTRYSQEVVTQICVRLASGQSLRAICADASMPGMSTTLGWLFDGKHEEFAEQYARAREAQAEGWADDIVAIADDAAGASNEGVQAARLRVDARKWVSSKLLPKRYGDKLQHTGEGGGAVTFVMKLHGDS